MNYNEFSDISIGTLTDEDIKMYCAKGNIISEDFNEGNIKQACYELRASNIYYDLADSNKKYILKEREYILLKPKQLVVVITLERLNLPGDILGRVLTKGMLFSLGLLPVNTYADPGFCGKLGIVFYNLSNNYIKLLPGQNIAKIEFSRMHKEVTKKYSGQHGYQTEIWPIRTDLLLTIEEINKEKRISSVLEEIELSYGQDIGSLVKRVFLFEKKLVLASVLFMVFSFLLYGAMVYKGADAKSIISPILGVVSGVSSQIIFGLFVNLCTSLKRRG